MAASGALVGWKVGGRGWFVNVYVNSHGFSLT